MLVVVSDTAPLNYLVWIEAVDVLPRLYGRVLIPPAVLEELSQSNTPDPVRLWLQNPPAWLEILSPRFPPDPRFFHLDSGEQAAILLALEQGANLLLIDERDGTRAALQSGLRVTGTLGVLDQAAARGWIDLPRAFRRLEQTSFRRPRKLMADLLEEDRKRSPKPGPIS